MPLTSFFGFSHFRKVLNEIGFNKQQAEEADRVINALSHDNVFQYRSQKNSESENNIFSEILEGIQNKYNFKT